MRGPLDGLGLFVTGAASGIGLATAQRARAQGARVVAADRDMDRLREEYDGSDVAVVPIDVTDEASVEAALDRATAALDGQIDALVHSAGRYEIEPTTSLSLAAWQRLMEVNATGSFLVARGLGRRLLATGRPGSMVLLSSIAGEHGDDAEPASHYGAGKAAVMALTRQLAVEWGVAGIRVNCVVPGLIRTPMLRITDDAARAARVVGAEVPLARLGEPDEVAAACLFLVGRDASYLTGALLTVDGGLTAR